MSLLFSRLDRARWRARLKKVASLRVDEWRLLAEATATMLVVQIALRFVAYPRLLAWATEPRTRIVSSSNRSATTAGADWSRERIERAAWIVGLGGRVTSIPCLARSLALARLLGRRGVVTDVRIGVRTDEGELEAHAWVEWRGSSITDSVRVLQPFAPLDRAPGEVRNA